MTTTDRATEALAQLLYSTEPHRGDQARLEWEYLPETDEVASHGKAHYRRWADKMHDKILWREI